MKSLLSLLKNLLFFSSVTTFIGKIFATVILPLVEAILVNLATSAPNPTPYTLCLVLVGVLHLVFALAIIFEQPFPHTVLDDIAASNDRLAESKSEASRLERWASAYDQAIYAANASLIRIEDLVAEGVTDQKTIFEQVLQPWVAERSPIFFFDNGSALFSFAVYLQGDDGWLDVVYRCNDDRLIARNRRWQPGDGHVGICFLRKQQLFMNVGEEGLVDALATTQPRTEDSQYYRSMVATPLQIEQETKGVLIITSSFEGQFVEIIHGNIIDNMGLLLSQAMKECHVFD